MKSPKTKKVVRAWALVVGDDVWATYPERDFESVGKTPLEYIIVPCTISYQPPTKNSAGKVGKRGV